MELISLGAYSDLKIVIEAKKGEIPKSSIEGSGSDLMAAILASSAHIISIVTGVDEAYANTVLADAFVEILRAAERPEVQA